MIDFSSGALLQGKETLESSLKESQDERLELERQLRASQAHITTLDKQSTELLRDLKLMKDQLDSATTLLANYHAVLGNPEDARANLDRVKEALVAEQQRVAELQAQRAKDVDVGLSFFGGGDHRRL